MSYKLNEDREEQIDEHETVQAHSRKKNRNAVRKRRKKRNRLLKNILKTVGILIVVFLIVSLFTFRVKNLQITGNDRVSNEEIQTLIKWDACKGNTLLLWAMNRKVNVSENELLSKVSVKIVNPHTVKVAVEENTLVGCVKSGNQYYYLDENGAIILSQAEKLTEVPILEDLKIQTTETGDYLETTDMALLESLLDIATKLTDYGVASDSISVTEEGMYVAKMGKVTIQLGYNKNIDEKISELKDLLPELDGLSGILHLEDYDSTKDSIIFEKDS